MSALPADLPADFFTKPVSEVDPEIAEVLTNELSRQEHTLEMIASENFVPQAVLDCQGSVLTNKYAEGYPGRRYYGGCEHVDVAEQLAIDRAKELFGAEHANVQPNGGASANAIVYSTLMEHGETFLGMKLDHGGHLTHGMKINFSGLYYNVVPYGVDKETSLLDMDEVARLAEEHRPKMILAGWSAYPREMDFARFREIADSVGAYLFVDMAHFAGLVAGGEYPNPVPHAHVVTTTIHKTLGGPRSGMILCKDEFKKKINSRTFPGWQGGPLMHVIAAKAVALKIAASPEFRERQQRTRAGARAVAKEMLGGGLNVLTGGTDTHLVLADLRESPLNGQQAEDRLAEVGITVNRNAVPFDPRPPAVASGLRIGASGLATRGLQESDFHEIGKVITEALTGDLDDAKRAALTERTRVLAKRYPLYPQLASSSQSSSSPRPGPEVHPAPKGGGGHA
ncbi:MAG: serine hydroxymethyltransferase [Pseudonocardiaceae bacterium]